MKRVRFLRLLVICLALAPAGLNGQRTDTMDVRSVLSGVREGGLSSGAATAFLSYRTFSICATKLLLCFGGITDPLRRQGLSWFRSAVAVSTFTHVICIGEEWLCDRVVPSNVISIRGRLVALNLLWRFVLS